MRVLHLISSGGMYGAEAVILQLCAQPQADARSASSLGVFAHAGQPAPELHRVAAEEGLRSELIPCRGQLDVSVRGSIRALVQGVGADVVHTHGYKADIYTFGAYLGADRPALVSTCHTWYDNDVAVRLYGAADRWVLRHFDEVVAVSSEVRDRLSSAGLATERIHLIRNGVKALSCATDTMHGRRQSSGEALRVGLVGRLAPEKGIDLYLRAVARLAHRFPRASFVVAGDGPDRAELEALIGALGLAGRAELLGQQAGMGALYGSLDLVVSASRHEGLPMALLEGMAWGLPVVATRVGEVPAAVEDGVTGLLVAPGSPEELAGGMERLLRDPALRERFGVAGRERVARHFSAERMAADYRAVYERALRRRAGRWQGQGAAPGKSAA